MQNRKPISFEKYRAGLSKDQIQQAIWSLERKGIKKTNSLIFDQQFDEEVKIDYDSMVAQDLMFFEE